ncbi:MAG: hypothetical protein R3E48_07270 [Burkholderiaceae bacterium]
MNANLHALADDSLDRADLPPPRTGPQVWYGPQMVASDQWLFGLSDTHVAEVEAAMRLLVDAGTDIATIRREHFPLPTLGPAIESLRRELIDGRGFLVMRRLPVERWSIREAATAYYGSAVGSAMPARRTGRGTCWAMCAISGRERSTTRPRGSTRRASARPFIPTPAMRSRCCA